MNHQAVRDLALHASNRFDRVMVESLQMFDDYDEQLSFIVILGEYILRMLASASMQQIADCKELPAHQQSMVLAGVLSHMTANTFGEKTSELSRDDLVKIARAIAALRRELTRCGFLVTQEQQ